MLGQLAGGLAVLLLLMLGLLLLLLHHVHLLLHLVGIHLLMLLRLLGLVAPLAAVAARHSVIHYFGVDAVSYLYNPYLHGH